LGVISSTGRNSRLFSVSEKCINISWGKSFSRIKAGFLTVGR
jgi:hypothetical protein